MKHVEQLKYFVELPFLPNANTKKNIYTKTVQKNFANTIDLSRRKTTIILLDNCIVFYTSVWCFYVSYRNVKVFPGAHFGPGYNPVIMDGLICVGTETDLSYCSFRGWGNSNCAHGQDAGVSCRKYFSRNVL